VRVPVPENWAQVPLEFYAIRRTRFELARALDADAVAQGMLPPCAAPRSSTTWA